MSAASMFLQPASLSCWLITLFVLCFRPAVAQPALTARDLRCEYLMNPLGIDERTPRLSWTLQSGERAERQTAYQVLVASSEERLRANRGELWDSGRVAGSQTAQVVYGGKK